MPLAVSFHGGAPSTTDQSHHHAGTAINTIMTVDGATLAPALEPGDTTLRELRAFTLDPGSGQLYVVNAYKEAGAIYVFDPPSDAIVGAPYVYSSTFASASKHLDHPFDLVFGPDGDVYVSNQDTGEITVFHGPAHSQPGSFKHVFAKGFGAVRGLACDGTSWYVADAGSKSKPAGVWVYDLAGTAQAAEPLAVPQPVHLLYDGARYLYVGSESTDSVYRLDTTATGAVPGVFVDGTGVIDKTSGLALDGTTLYVASRKGQSLFTTDVSSAAPTLSPFGPAALGDQPEFLAWW